MYYIVNETNQIIAADESLLALCGFTHINDLNSNITLEKIIFNTNSNNQLNITQNMHTQSFSISYTTLSSLLGQLTLITLETSKEVKNSTMQNDIDIDTLLIKADTPKETINFIDTIENELEVDESNIDIKDEVSTHTDLDTSDIVIDIEKVSQEIGISKEDFNIFLNEYINTALDLEEDLKSIDDKKCSNATEILLHLGEVLHMSKLEEILQNIRTSSPSTRSEYVVSFYNILSRITTTQPNLSPTQVTNTSSHDTNIEDDNIVLFDLGLNSEETLDTHPTIEDEINLEIKTPKQVPKEMTSFGDIDLSKVQPIYFEFNISSAADELSLPENLIEEFMLDFVEQAHAETDKMLIAYKKGDLKSVNKIAHLLKGVSSNLHIIPLSETLYKIQFYEQTDHLESLIKEYWGHFLFFEKQINMLSN